MGTDIHTALEVQIKGKWKSLTEFGPYDDDDEDGYLYPKNSIADDRNYGFFAAMANVRNGFAFAGVDTGDAIKPISAPRGLPNDLSPEVQAWVDQGIEHTPSYHTLSDLLTYDWCQTRTQRGIVDCNEWSLFASKGQPDSWSGGISGPGIVMVDPTDFALRWEETKRKFDLPDKRWPSGHLRYGSGEEDEAIKNFFLKPWIDKGQRPYTQVEWSNKLYHSIGDQAAELIFEMLAACKKYNVQHDRVRIVFYFDS